MDKSVIHRYESPERDFALALPLGWAVAAPDLANSPHEKVRFIPSEEGKHLLIVYREAYDPLGSLQDCVMKRRQVLAGVGFRGFHDEPASIRSKPAWTLDLEKQESGGIWSCRYYFLAEGIRLYRLGFGTTDKDRMFPAFDAVAQSLTLSTDLSKAWCPN